MKRYRVLSQQPLVPPVDQKEAKALAAHRDSLYARLDVGYERIAQGLRDGQDVTSWEDFWIQLLKEYEKVCDELTADLAAGAVREAEGQWTEQRLEGVR